MKCEIDMCLNEATLFIKDPEEDMPICEEHFDIIYDTQLNKGKSRKPGR